MGTYLGAHRGAVHDGVAPVQLVGVVHLVQPLLRGLITRVNDPPARQPFLTPGAVADIQPTQQHKKHIDCKQQAALAPLYRAYTTILTSALSISSMFLKQVRMGHHRHGDGSLR